MAWSLRCALRRVLSLERFDIIRTIGQIPTWAAVKERRGPTRIFADLTDFAPDLYADFELPASGLATRLLSGVEREIAHEVDYAHVDTPSGRKEWSHLGLSASKIAAIPNGVDVIHFASRPVNRSLRERFSPDGVPLFSFHGDIGKTDGLEYLLRAISEDSTRMNALIMGTGNPRLVTHLKKLRDLLGLRKHVHFAGWINYENLPDYVNLADVCVSPFANVSRQTNSVLPQKIREALALNKAVLTTKTEGLHASLGSLPTYVHNPSDSRELASAAVLALKKSYDPRQVARQKTIVKNLDWQRVISQDFRFMKAMTEGVIDNASKYDLILDEDS